MSAKVSKDFTTEAEPVESNNHTRIPLRSRLEPQPETLNNAPMVVGKASDRACNEMSSISSVESSNTSVADEATQPSTIQANIQLRLDEDTISASDYRDIALTSEDSESKGPFATCVISVQIGSGRGRRNSSLFSE